MERRNKEIVFLQGGLGNQMFQYAFYLAKKHTNMDAVYDTGLLRLYRQHNGYELEHLFDIGLFNKFIIAMAIEKKEVYIQSFEALDVFIDRFYTVHVCTLLFESA